MKILYVSPHGFREHTRSFTNYVLARAMARRGHKVIAYAAKLDDDASTETIDSVTIRRFPELIQMDPLAKKKDFLRFWPLAWKNLRSDKPDVVHLFHLSSPYNYHFFKAAHWMKIPVVLSEWGILHNDFLAATTDNPLKAEPTYGRVIKGAAQLLIRNNRYGDTWKGRLRNYCRHRVLYKSDKLLFLSAHNYPYLRSLNVPDDKIAFLRNPFDLSLAEVAREREAEWRTASRPWILFIGQLKLRKGFDLFIEAMPRLLREFPGATFFFICHNWKNNRHYDWVMKKVEELGISPHFRFLGSVSESEKWTLLESADVFVAPSRYEGFGLPLLEAMLVECPIVAADVVALTELVSHEHNGLLFPIEDIDAMTVQVARIIKDENLRERLVRNGSEYVKTHDVIVHIEEFERLYESVIEK
ncbi:MAG: glycosyltransferase family 1 protein [Candidatus Abyssobacteria bacterium SURF_5]|uniref:Glycosyltransferase family 1 protein n=1 Tax=Abyssobacteria bacterium (strain SURF_5) TaxID=2093360 RepID=A0A3A4NIH2_ABYX5|nr:MAG: glycosyltransferase family 1 protein [Candidatus Abyssubacteria bacterium SURF_5]